MIDLRKYEFSIIYGIDVPKNTSLEDYTPPNYPQFWNCTESGESESFNKGRHRKHCAILNWEQFLKFIEKVGLRSEKIYTMGSLGAPGFGIGWAPAVCFVGENYEVDQNAYVTPIPPNETNILAGMPEDICYPNWDDVEQMMWEVFEDGAYSAEQWAEEIENEEVLV